MIAILKIRFCVLKRHYIKTFFICFLPSILIFLFSLAGKKLIGDINNKEGISHYDQKKIIDFNEDSAGYFESDEYQTLIANIVENETLKSISYSKIKDKKEEFDDIKIMNFTDMKEYDDFYDNDYENQDYKMMIMFELKEKKDKSIIFNLKDNIIELKKLGQLKNRLSFIQSSNDTFNEEKNKMKYITDRFLIAQEIFTNYSNSEKINLKMESLPMKSRPLLNGLAQENVSQILGMYLALCYFMSFSELLDSIVEEKQKKLNLLLFRQGITIIKYNLSWFIYFLCVHFVPLLLCSMITNFALFYHNNFFISIFFSLFLFEIQLFSYVYFITTFMNKDSSSGLMKSIYIILTLLGTYILDPDVNYYYYYFFQT